MVTKKVQTIALLDIAAFDRLLTDLWDFESDLHSPRGLLTANAPYSLAHLYVSGDAGAIAQREREEKVRERWAELQQHPLLIQLMRDPGFSMARETFNKLIKAYIVDEINYLVRVVFRMYQYLGECNFPALIKVPGTRARRNAVTAATRLQQLFEEGACLEQVMEQNELKRLLMKLKLHMDIKPLKQLRRDETFIERRFVKRLAIDFISLYKQPLSSVLKQLAAIIGYDPDERNIEKIISDANMEEKQKKRAAIIEALSEQRGIPSTGGLRPNSATIRRGD